MNSRASTSRRSGGGNASTMPLQQPSSSSIPMSPYSDAPPAYESIASTSGTQWASSDPRHSSTQSLVPSESNTQAARRKLLIIYIHGFMGNETSFRSFPAHVHNLLTVLMSQTHVVHTKVYPRYRSKKNITFARDDFSKWLEPHEAEKTDVVLLGHSMGGLLSAEVVLVQPAAPASRPLKHRILGTINFDVPFLGMHPGVVKSGLASMFKSAEVPEDQYSPTLLSATGDGGAISPVSSLGQSGRMDTLWQPQQQDPNFNPSFNNDVVLPMRKGWKNAWHFVHKHSNNFGDLTKATKNLVTSHLEFGGAMANYGELKSRYGRLRALEEESESVRKSTVKTLNVAPARVRFVNYYTASTGRISKSKSDKYKQMLSPSRNASRTSLSPSDADLPARGRQPDQRENRAAASMRSISPRISLEEHHDEGYVVSKEPEIPDSPDEDWQEAAEMLTIEDPPTGKGHASELPPKPAPLDVSYIHDPAIRKLVEQEHTRAAEAYEQALRSRAANASTPDEIKDVAEVVKPESDMTQSEREELRLRRERERMEAEGRRMRGEKSPDRLPETERVADVSARTPSTSVPSPSNMAPDPPSPSPPLSRSPSRSQSSSGDNGEPTKKDRKFCTLPPKDSAGQLDPTWVRVFMKNVDEVGAHCGLFFVDERYERLVGDVASRVEKWIYEDADARAAHNWNEKS